MSGGPAKNHVAEVPDYIEDYKIRMAEPAKLSIYNVYPMGTPTYKEGSYHKSNVQMKNGTWVFRWMGWYNS